MNNQSSKLRWAVKAALGTAVAVPLAIATSPAMAQSNADLQKQIDSLQAQLDQLDSNQSATSGQIGNTDVSINGYFKLDTYYDFDGVENQSILPSQAADGDGYFGLSANETRLKISTTTHTGVGDVGGYFEGDWWNGELRIRQGFITYGNWQFGKAWSTFANLNYGQTLNFGGPAGQSFGRQGLIRYNQAVGANSTFSVSVEDYSSYNSVLKANKDFINDDKDSDKANSITKVPGLAASFEGQGQSAGYKVAAYVSQLKAKENKKDSAAVWGVNAGGNWAATNSTTLMFVANYGEGMGNMIYTPVLAGGYAGYFDGNDKLQTLEQLGVNFTINQQFSEKWSGNIVLGFSEAKDDDSKSAKGQSAGVNLLFNPVEPLTLGGEYTYVKQKIDNNFAGTVGAIDENTSRLQFSAIYNF